MDILEMIIKFYVLLKEGRLINPQFTFPCINALKV